MHSFKYSIVHTILVLSSIFSLVPPPNITENPAMLVNTTVGHVVTFHCKAESFGNQQALKYHWLKIVNDNKTIIDGANTSVLEFVATSNNDSTYYQCGATNENDTTISTPGRLNCKDIVYSTY